MSKNGPKYPNQYSEKISFEEKFSRNCSQMNEEFEWVEGIKEMVTSSKIPKEKFLSEMNELKKDVFNKVSSEILLENPEEINSFKEKIR